MSRFADPETVACPNCKSYFYRKLPKSITMHYHISFTDGGVKSFVKEMLPELGRCRTCRFIVEKIADLEVIYESENLVIEKISRWQAAKQWISALFINPNPYDLSMFERKYDYLPAPTFDEYAELFTVSVDESKKRLRAVQACREFHQQFCLSAADQEVIHRHKGYRLQTDQEQRQYNEMADFLLAHPLEPAVDEYILLCADILRMRAEFSKASALYVLVENADLNDVVELGRKLCEEQNIWLMRLNR